MEGKGPMTIDARGPPSLWSCGPPTIDVIVPCRSDPPCQMTRGTYMTPYVLEYRLSCMSSIAIYRYQKADI